MCSSTLLVTIISITILWAAALIGVEFYQIKTGNPVITRVMIAAVKKTPWVFILLAFMSGFMMSHCSGT